MTTLDQDLVADVTPDLPPPVLEQSRLSRLVVAMFAVGALALGAITVWAVVTRDGGSSEPDAWRPATAEMIKRVDDSLAAYNSGDMDALGAMFAENGIFEEPQSPTAPTRGIVGRADIVKAQKYLWGMGARYHRIGLVAQNGNTVAFPVSCETCPGFVGETDVILFDDAGLILHYWTIVR